MVLCILCMRVFLWCVWSVNVGVSVGEVVEGLSDRGDQDIQGGCRELHTVGDWECGTWGSLGLVSPFYRHLDPPSL